VTGNFVQFQNTYLKPGDPSYDRGNCPYNQRLISNWTAAYLTPQFSDAVVRAVASDWRVSGIVTANSGNWLTVTTTSDLAFNGIPNQRVNQVSDDPFGDKSLTNYLSAAAFAMPAAGTLGDHAPRSIEGPGFWKIDMSVARVLSLANQHTLEFRVEAFNVTNNFNWGDPNVSLNAGTFGRITTQVGDSRIMQFAVKYGF
jgi:hypothetical protein